MNYGPTFFSFVSAAYCFIAPSRYDSLFAQTRLKLLKTLDSKGKVSLDSQTMSLLLELRQSCCHPQIVTRQQKLMGGSLKKIGRLSLQTIIERLLNSEANRHVGELRRQKKKKKEKLDGNVAAAAKLQYLTNKAKQYGITLSDAIAKKLSVAAGGRDVVKEKETDTDISVVETCCICMDLADEMVIAKGCAHTFCASCIAAWLREKCPQAQQPDRRAPCPECRVPLHAKDLAAFSNVATALLSGERGIEKVSSSSSSSTSSSSSSSSSTSSSLKKSDYVSNVCFSLFSLGFHLFVGFPSVHIS